MNISGFDYEKIENPFDISMEREGGLFGTPGMVDLGEAGKNIEGTIEDTVSDTTEDKDKVIQGQNLENLWIDKWIKSRSYRPGSSGFMIDGRTGKIECGNLVVRGIGEIGGWNIDATRIYSDDDGLILDSSVPKIESGNYVSGYAGSGVHLSPNLLEVGNIACRGIFRSAVMQYNNTFAYGGNQIVAKGADVLKTDMTAADNSTIEIENDSEASAWAVGDILQLDNANDTEWLEITSVLGNVYTCDRDKKGDYVAGANPVWKKGQAVVNYGQSGDGGMYTTASETNAPYLSIFTHGGEPWLRDDSAPALITRLRIGNLNGFLNEDSDVYGIAIGETDEYLKYNPTDGMKIAGNITMLSGSLIAGNIISEQILLTVSHGEGDVRISGGLGLDYINWTANKGFILGLDDSDSDTAKFFVGDHANNKYLSFDGTNTDATGFRYLQTYTTGENIAIEDVVCIKNIPKDDFVTIVDDAHTNAYAEYDDINYGTSTTLRIGYNLGSCIFYMKLPTAGAPSIYKIQKVELLLYCSHDSLNAARRTISLTTVDADWDESTITENNQPTSTDNLTSTYFNVNSFEANYGWNTIDITQYYKYLINGDIDNYGLKFVSEYSGAEYAEFNSSEHAEYNPIVRITAAGYSDNKIYKASTTDYNLCRTIVGFATETITSDNPCIVQNKGTIPLAGFDTPGSNIYLTTSGDIVSGTVASVARNVSIGYIENSDTNCSIDIQRKDIFIEKPAIPAGGISYGVQNKFMSQGDATMCKIVVAYSESGGKSAQMEIIIKKGTEDGSKNYHIFGDVDYITVSWTLSGTAEYITFSGTGGINSITIYSISFYK